MRREIYRALHNVQQAVDGVIRVAIIAVAVVVMPGVVLITDSTQAAPLQADTSDPHHDHHAHHGHSMTLDSNGMVMNSNANVLPNGCEELGPEIEFTVAAGSEFARDNPGTMFGYSQHEFLVEPCSRITITLVNKDEIRHQWMVHGLPKYLYPGGMFHLEAAGGQSKTGVFIAPPEHRTYLVHCDIAQHMEKGMKGQLKVGRGSGDLWGIPGVSGAFFADSYLPGNIGWITAAVLVAAMLIGFMLLRRRFLN